MTDKVNSKGSNWGKLGGSHKMHSFAPTGTQTPGQSSQEGHSGSRRDIAAKGGGRDTLSSQGQMNKDYAGTQAAGESASNKSGPNNKWAEGGKTSMHGNRGSRPMPAGQSGPN